jgi:hypothetical protein
MTSEARNEGSPQTTGSALDFQTAPYESLCGCVAVLIPAGMTDIWPDDGTPNHKATEALIRDSEGRRNVEVNCPKCGGTGIAPNKGIDGKEPTP